MNTIHDNRRRDRDVPARGDAPRPVRRGGVAGWPIVCGPLSVAAETAAGQGRRQGRQPRPRPSRSSRSSCGAACRTTTPGTRSPASGYDYMGEFDKVIPTNVHGIQIGELFPKLAKQADKFSLIRSMTHRNNGHETAAYLMQTGHTPGERLAYPSVGRRLRLLQEARSTRACIPPYVVLDAAAGAVLRGGLPGPDVQAFRHRRRSRTPPASRSKGIVARGITDERQKARRELLDKIEHLGHGHVRPVPEMAAAEAAKQSSLRVDPGHGQGGVRPLQGEAGTAGPLRPPHVRAGMPGGAAAGRGGRALHRDQLPRRLGHAQQPLRDHAAAVPAAGPGTGDAAGGSERSRLAGEHPGLVLPASSAERRRSTGSRPGTAAAITTATSSPCWSPAADSRAATSSARPTTKAEEVKDRPVYPVDLLGSIYQLGRHRRHGQAAPSHGAGGPRVARRQRRREVGRAFDGDHVAFQLADRGHCR